MKLKNKNKSKKFSISIVLYIVTSVVALVGIASLVNSILLFRDSVNQYVAQGYSVATVTKQLIPSQLLPGIFQSIALYGGIAFALLGMGIVNKKVSKCLMLLTKVDVENTETTEQTEPVEEIENIEKIKKSISNV